MTILIQRRDVGEPARVEAGSAPVRKETEFSTLLQALSQKKAPPRNEQIYEAVSIASERHDLPPALLLAVIKQESGFNPNAVSPCGAQGLMQLMPGTADLLGVKDSFDVDQNVDGGARYLRQMLDRFGGDVKLALAAYNAGPGRVEQFGGIPPFEETMNYVPSVLAHYAEFNGSPSFDFRRVPDPQMIALAVATATALSTPPPLPFPEKQKNDEPPPPPPPRSVRV